MIIAKKFTFNFILANHSFTKSLVSNRFGNHIQDSRSEDEDALLQSHDGQMLIRILDELTGHKEDSQQRTWAVHEDKEIIHKLLKDLLTILVSVSRFFTLLICLNHKAHYPFFFLAFHHLISQHMTCKELPTNKCVTTNILLMRNETLLLCEKGRWVPRTLRK